MDRGAWWATVLGVVKSRTQLSTHTHTHTHTLHLQSVILSEVRQRRKISYDIPYMWNLKRNDTNELTYKTERDSQKINLRLPGEKDS